MKIIAKTFLKDRSIKRYILIFAILLILLFTLYNLKNGLSLYIHSLKNEETYRTIIVKFKDNLFDSNQIKNKKYILSVKIDNQETNDEEKQYRIEVKDVKYIQNFIKDYEKHYKNIFYKTFEMPKLYIILWYSINIITIIFIVITFIMTTINIIETITTRRNEISFYKLIGYKNKYIFELLYLILIKLYILTYIVSIFLSYILSLIINQVLLRFKILFSLSLISVKFNIFVLLNIFLIITIVIYIFLNKAKKISPIEFMRCF